MDLAALQLETKLQMMLLQSVVSSTDSGVTHHVGTYLFRGQQRSHLLKELFSSCATFLFRQRARS